ncbi:MAG: Very-short-patch-repair endonuclease [Bacteroidota bacterium]|nr:Very-short-patch-repair endonuclease [Bacteroidota bacterium]
MFESSIRNLCRQLRQNQTQSEIVLWEELRGRQFTGYKLRRQHPFIYQSIQGKRSFFIADFYFPKGKLIVELDGKIHDSQKDYDQNRDLILSEFGLRTLRIKNEELENNLNQVLVRILAALTSSRHR